MLGPTALVPLRRSLLLVLLALSALLGVSFAARAAAAPQGAGASSSRTVVVRDGETLSGVAHRELGSMPLDRAVTSLVMANHLPSEQLTVGQELVIPAG